MTRRGVLFDVDGTLVDTTYLHAVCWHDAFAEYGHEIPMWQLHRAIGKGGDQILATFLDDATEEEAEAIDTAHRTRYQHLWPQLSAFESAGELVRACAKQNLTVVLASSAAEEELEMLRAIVDADEAITAATSSSDADLSKPHPDILGVALERGGLDAENTLFVGDAVWDGEACRRAGIRFVGLLCGGTSRHELLDAGAIEVWRDPADLLAHLDASVLIAGA